MQEDHLNNEATRWFTVRKFT